MLCQDYVNMLKFWSHEYAFWFGTLKIRVVWLEKWHHTTKNLYHCFLCDPSKKWEKCWNTCSFLCIFKIFYQYLQIWSPVVVNFLALWVWEITLMEAIWNDNNWNNSYRNDNNLEWYMFRLVGCPNFLIYLLNRKERGSRDTSTNASARRQLQCQAG